MCFLILLAGERVKATVVFRQVLLSMVIFGTGESNQWIVHVWKKAVRLVMQIYSKTGHSTASALEDPSALINLVVSCSLLLSFLVAASVSGVVLLGIPLLSLPSVLKQWELGFSYFVKYWFFSAGNRQPVITVIHVLVGEPLACYFCSKHSDLPKVGSVSVVAVFLAVGWTLTAGLVISICDSG